MSARRPRGPASAVSALARLWPLPSRPLTRPSPPVRKTSQHSPTSAMPPKPPWRRLSRTRLSCWRSGWLRSRRPSPSAAQPVPRYQTPRRDSEEGLAEPPNGTRVCAGRGGGSRSAASVAPRGDVSSSPTSIARSTRAFEVRTRGRIDDAWRGADPRFETPQHEISRAPPPSRNSHLKLSADFWAASPTNFTTLTTAPLAGSSHLTPWLGRGLRSSPA
mmetsp:Transcript_79774/g.227680  ORF Transcript_79774/g.227680 Transcript_79774/m.227680 type:complete len:218 (-) Transcript_79774:1057-1710(-)